MTWHDKFLEVQCYPQILEIWAVRPRLNFIICEPVFSIIFFWKHPLSVIFCYRLNSHLLQSKVKYGIRSPKFIWAPVYNCTHWLRPRDSPLSPHLGSCTRALLVSQVIRHLSTSVCNLLCCHLTYLWPTYIAIWLICDSLCCFQTNLRHCIAIWLTCDNLCCYLTNLPPLV